MADLLAWNVKKGLGKLLHVTGKKFMRWAINRLALVIMKDVIAHKKATGWHNHEMKILYDDLTQVIEQNRYKEDKEADTNYILFKNVRDIIVTLLDEDSYYLLRFYYWLDLTFEHENRYRIAHHKSRAYWDWEKIADFLKAERSEFEKLGIEPSDDDYNKMYMKAKEMSINGKTHVNDTGRIHKEAD